MSEMSKRGRKMSSFIACTLTQIPLSTIYTNFMYVVTAKWFCSRSCKVETARVECNIRGRGAVCGSRGMGFGADCLKGG